MNDPDTHHDDTSEKAVPASLILARWAKGVIVTAFVMLAWILFFAGVTVSIQTTGSSTIYTSSSPMEYVFYVFPVLTAILAAAYSLQPGIFRLLGTAIGLLTVWLAYNAFTLDTSNHKVIVTSTNVSREVGTPSEPIRHEIDFTTTAFLYIDQVPGDLRSEYELVAFADDNAETRVPIFDMMRSALPQILENASMHGVIIGEYDDGTAIPPALQLDAVE